MNYAFYINDERLCAHCTLEKLGGSSWYVIWNEPSENIRRAQQEEDEASGKRRAFLDEWEGREEIERVRRENSSQREIDEAASIGSFITR